MINDIPFISVVICTHKRVEWLALALESLANQSIPIEQFEVLVIDNNIAATPGLQECCEPFAKVLNLKVILDTRLGLSYARNTGWQHALADYIAYLDDDAQVDAGWVGAITGCINCFAPDICSGPCYPFYAQPKPLWFKDKYATSYVLGSRPVRLKRGQYCGGMNFIVRKKLLAELGGFDIAFGMTGRKIGIGEETLLIERAWNLKPDLLVFNHPGILVKHLVHPERLALLYQARRAWVSGREYQRLIALTRTIPSHKIKLFLAFVRHLLRTPRIIWHLAFPNHRQGQMCFHHSYIEVFLPWLTSLSSHFEGVFRKSRECVLNK